MQKATNLTDVQAYCTHADTDNQQTNTDRTQENDMQLHSKVRINNTTIGLKE